MSKHFTIKRIAIDALLLATLIICSLITIPFGTIPVTLQVFAIILVIFLLSNVDSIIIISTYAMMGSIGIPVFAGGSSGISGASFGFIIGFVVSSIIIFLYSLLFKKFRSAHKEIIDLIIKATLFIIIIYLIGMPYCMAYANMNFRSALIYFLPFVGIDIVKIIIAIIVYNRIKNIVNKEE